MKKAWIGGAVLVAAIAAVLYWYFKPKAVETPPKEDPATEPAAEVATPPIRPLRGPSDPIIHQIAAQTVEQVDNLLVPSKSL